MVKHLTLYNTMTNEIIYECDYDDSCYDAIDDILRSQYEVDFGEIYYYYLPEGQSTVYPACAQFTSEKFDFLNDKLAAIYDEALDSVSEDVEIRYSWKDKDGQIQYKAEPLKPILDNMIYGYEGALYHEICQSVDLFLLENEWQWGFRDSDGKLLNIKNGSFPKPQDLGSERIEWIYNGKIVSPIIWYGKPDSSPYPIMELDRDSGWWSLLSDSDEDNYNLEYLLPDDNDLKQSYYYYVAEYGGDLFPFDWDDVKECPIEFDGYGGYEKTAIDDYFMELYAERVAARLNS